MCVFALSVFSPPPGSSPLQGGADEAHLQPLTHLNLHKASGPHPTPLPDNSVSSVELTVFISVNLSCLVRHLVINLFFSSCVLFSSLCFAASCLSSCFRLVHVFSFWSFLACLCRTFVIFIIETFVWNKHFCAPLRQSGLCFGVQISQAVTELSGHKMDPAETSNLRQAFASQGVRMGQQEEALKQIMDILHCLSAGVSQLGSHLDQVSTHLLAAPSPASAPAPASPPAPNSAPVPPFNHPCEPFIPIPARYSGVLGICSQFLHHCSLVFDQQPLTYSTDKSKIAFIMSLLSDKAFAWALAVSDSNSPL